MISLQKTLEALLDYHLNQQNERLYRLFTKYFPQSKTNLEEIKASQNFLGSKFHELVILINEVKEEKRILWKSNEQLQQRVYELEEKAVTTDTELEALRHYSRWDTLEIQGVPVNQGENTNLIALKVAQMVVPEVKFDQSIISVSHRLPTVCGYMPKIIVKFDRTDIRDMVYQKRRNIAS